MPCHRVLSLNRKRRGIAPFPAFQLASLLRHASSPFWLAAGKRVRFPCEVPGRRGMNKVSTVANNIEVRRFINSKTAADVGRQVVGRGYASHTAGIMLTIETLSAWPMTCPGGVQRDQTGGIPIRQRASCTQRRLLDRAQFWQRPQFDGQTPATHRLFTLTQEMFELGEVHLDALTVGSVVNFACCSGVEKDNCEC
jgi:hypothetical protein